MSVALWCSWVVAALACLLAWYCVRELDAWIAVQELHELRDHAEIRQWMERAHAAEEQRDTLMAMIVQSQVPRSSVDEQKTERT